MKNPGHEGRWLVSCPRRDEARPPPDLATGRSGRGVKSAKVPPDLLSSTRDCGLICGDARQTSIRLIDRAVVA
eukprot:scaffold3353_cov63-Phaeocystis_antarctica.AAC.3